jgi:hypothetical protein
MSQQKSKQSIDLIGTPRFQLAFLKEGLEFERECGEFMKKLIEERKNTWPESTLKLANSILNQHRINYKNITKEIENL